MLLLEATLMTGSKAGTGAADCNHSDTDMFVYVPVSSVEELRLLLVGCFKALLCLCFSKGKCMSE